MACVLFTIVGLLWIPCSLAQVCNPVINVNSGCGCGENDSDHVTVRTEIQVEQAKELFQNVSETFIAEYDNRLEAIVSTVTNDCPKGRPKDCQDVFDQGDNQTGIYTIYPQGTRGFPVRCDMETVNGGWTVFQRRVSDSDFYKTWNEYQTGFGNLSENFWLGNQQLHMITAQGWYELRIDMTHSNGSSRYAAYNVFSIGNAESRYKLTVDGYHGNAGDSLTLLQHGQRFTTKDRDYDRYSGNCATLYLGAWWYKACHRTNLNGDYGNNQFGKGLTWYAFTGFYTSLVKTEMKIRRWAP